MDGPKYPHAHTQNSLVLLPFHGSTQPFTLDFIESHPLETRIRRRNQTAFLPPLSLCPLALAMETAGGSKWSLIRPFLVILLIHSLAIYLFTRGFLLTRIELASFSHCSDLTHSPCSSISSSHRRSNFTPPPDESPDELHQDRRCWTKPAVDRLVIIVLDALR